MPSPALGNYAFGVQTQKGTAATLFPWTAGFTADGSKPDLTTKPYYTGFSRSQTTQLATGFQYKGDVTLVLTQNATTALMRYAMGGADTMTGSAAPYTHTLALGLDDLPWVTIQRQFNMAAYTENVIDCKVDSFTISGKAGDLLTAKFAFIGLTARAIVAAPATPVFETLGPATYAMSAVTLSVGGHSVSGAMQDWEFDVKNQLEFVPQAGNLIGAGLVPKVRSVSGKATPTFEVTDAVIQSVYGYTTSADPSLPGGALANGALEILTTWSANETQALSMPNVLYTAADPVLSTDGKTMTTPLTFTAVIESGNDEFGVVTVNSTETPF